MAGCRATASGVGLDWAYSFALKGHVGKFRGELSSGRPDVARVIPSQGPSREASLSEG